MNEPALYGLIITYLCGILTLPPLIPLLKRLKFGQQIREEGPKSHYKKAGTPTMGGLNMIFGIVLVTLAFFFVTGKVDFYAFLMMLVYGAVGFLDDLIGIVQKHNEGLTVMQKLLLQIVAALFFTVWAYFHVGTVLYVPFYGPADLGLLTSFITFIAILSITNAVNLSDGLDGLCSGLSLIVMVFFLIVALLRDETGLSIFAGCFIGACLAFLCYNIKPAKVFMGDTGSMALGGALCAVAIKEQMLLYFLIAGFVFVLEALSVVMQVGYFKLSHGKRIFRMAPLHHHFELGGKPEMQVVMMFWSWAVIGVTAALIVL